jgi:multiple sugar transport system substrate-binding protein
MGMVGRVKIAVALVLGVAAATTGGCGSGSGGADGKVHLTYAMWDTPEAPGYQRSIQEFQKSHPNITVSIQTFAYNNYQPKLTTEFSSGGGPDIYWVNTPMIAEWIKDGVMADLTDRIRSANIDLNQYLQPLVDLHRYSGKLYGLPKDWDTIAFFYNADYFAQHHITMPTDLAWNPSDGGSWLTFLKQLTVDTAGHDATSPQFNPSSVATYGVDSPNEMQWGFEPFLAENGVKIIDRPYAKGVAFNTPAGQQTFQFLVDLMYRYHLAVPGSDLGTNAASNNNEDLQLFAQGKVAMIEGGSWETSGIKQAVKFKLGVMEAPAGPQGKWTVLNGLIDAVNAHGKHQDAAWQLEQWLGSPESERILAGGGYIWPGIPTLDNLYADYWKQQGVDVSAFMTESKWNTVTWPVTPGMNQAQLDIANLLAPAYLNQQSVPSAVAKAAGQANSDLSAAG